MREHGVVYLECAATELGYGPFELVSKPRCGTWCLRQCGNADGGMLRVRPRFVGTVDFNGGGGPWSQWRREEYGDFERLVNVGDPSRVLVGSTNDLATTADRDTPACLFRVAISAPARVASSVAGGFNVDESVDFTRAEYEHFDREGYVIARGVVDSEAVDRALRVINAELCRPGSVVPNEDGMGMTICDEASRDVDVGGILAKSPKALALVERLVGRGAVANRRHLKCQVALRKPELGLTEDQRMARRAELAGHQWHVDGMVKNRHTPFNLLVGVALSDQTQPGAGQLVVYPGSHRVILDAYRDRVERHNGELYVNGPDPNKPLFVNAVDVNLRPGDVVFVHQKTAHKVGENTSPNIRYQLYFRLSHVDRERSVESGSALTDIRSGLDGLRAALQQPRF
ncbi:hypothetical protein CTAYLR_000238 [Chrysophaeum taylorii]|uniref:Uncharacterized protein n=1 Tax=Chrysophaeum taylorii TaxID=2483200 RepID=A0AAD7XM35_9STRA|nr:hypothetical protein CTAYLR_000238 [Chrysophaeum taylorii]